MENRNRGSRLDVADPRSALTPPPAEMIRPARRVHVGVSAVTEMPCVEQGWKIGIIDETDSEFVGCRNRISSNFVSIVPIPSAAGDHARRFEEHLATADSGSAWEPGGIGLGLTDPAWSLHLPPK